jgi:two-component system sensor histidine kinase QseC
MSSIQRRLTVALAALCCVLWFGGGVAAYLTMRHGLIREFDDAHVTDINSLSNMTEQNRAGLKFDSTGEYMPAFRREERPDYFQLWETDGTVLYRSPALEGNLPQRAGTLAAPRFWNVTLPDGEKGRAVGVRFVPNEDDEMLRPPDAPPLTKEVILVAAFHRQELDQRLHYIGMVLLLSGLGMAAVAIVAVGFIVRRGLRPLSTVANRAAAIDASSLQLRFPTENLPAELLPIATRLNDLLARLEGSFARERRFSADVAHELRTPIAELRALAEVALKWPEGQQATQHALQDALAIALQMESIATGLIALARCEGNLLTVQSEPVAIRALIQNVLTPLTASASAKQLDITLHLPKEACWYTDAAALRSIVANLVTNAIDYSPAASPIRVRLCKNGAGEELSIVNQNVYLAPEDLSHLFERFWRKDPARSSQLHSGLGLALAKAYAQSLGMKLQAELSHAEIVFTLSGATACNDANG